MKPANLSVISVALGFALLLVGVSAAQTRIKLSLAPCWRFCLGSAFGEVFATDYDDSQWELVSIPHSPAQRRVRAARKANSYQFDLPRRSRRP